MAPFFLTLFLSLSRLLLSTSLFPMCFSAYFLHCSLTSSLPQALGSHSSQHPFGFHFGSLWYHLLPPKLYHHPTSMTCVLPDSPGSQPQVPGDSYGPAWTRCPLSAQQLWPGGQKSGDLQAMSSGGEQDGLSQKGVWLGNK